MTINFELPSSWVSVELGTIVDPVSKVQPTENPDKEFVYLDIASIDNTKFQITEPKIYIGQNAPSRARQRVKTGDILFSTVRTYLKNIAFVPEIYDGQIASTGFCVIRPAWPINNKFYFYLAQTNDFLNPLNEIQRGTSYPAVRNSDVFAQTVPLPPLNEQRRIVNKIETLFTKLDAGVAALQYAKAQLKRYRQSVLKAAFSGKLTEEWRETHKEKLEPASKLLEIIAGERKKILGNKYKEPTINCKELQEIPSSWSWGTVEMMCSHIVDCLHSTAKFEDKGFLCIDTNCIKQGKIVFEEIRYVSEETYKDRIRRLEPQEGDILFSREGTIGISLTVPPKTKLCLGQRMMMFRTLEQFDNKYFMYSLSSPYFQKQMSYKIMGTTSPHVNIGEIRKMILPFPSIEEQRQIVDEVEKLMSVIDNQEQSIEKQIQEAGALRQSLLKQAFSGKLVAQDPTDETAEVLLARIKTEKAKLQAEKKVPATKRLKKPSKHPPFSIPKPSQTEEIA